MSIFEEYGAFKGGLQMRLDTDSLQERQLLRFPVFFPTNPSPSESGLF